MCTLNRSTATFLQFFIISLFVFVWTPKYSLSQDMYENDDTYQQANVIVPNYIDAQEHTLHDSQDHDWVKFYAIAGQSYMILNSWSSSVGGRYILLYGPGGDTLVDYALNSTLYWQCPAGKEGIYYVELFAIQQDPGVVSYSVQVRTYLGLGLPVYLTGQVKNTCNQPVSNAQIVVAGASDTNSGLSLPNGSFIASLKFSGSYTVTVYATNHQALVQNVYVPGNTTFWMTKLNNNPPVANDDQVGCSVKKSVSGNVLNNDFDPDGDPLVAVLDSNVKNGSLVFSSTGAFTYTHNGSRTTSDSFTYHLSDGCAVSKSVKVNIKIGSTPLTFLMLLLR